MGNLENYIDKIPASACQEGFVEGLNTTVPEGHILNTEEFRQLLSEKYKMPELSETMRKSYYDFLTDSPISATRDLLKCFIPEEEGDFYGEINEYLYENLGVAKEILGEKMAENSIDEEEMYMRVMDGECLSPDLQFAVSQVHEYAWYLALFNHQQVYKIAKKNPMWGIWNENERQDFLHSCLIGSWTLACRFDSQKGHFVNYLNASLPGVSIQKHTNFIKGERVFNEGYLNLYRVATAMLGEIKKPRHDDCVILTSLLYDRNQGRVIFPEESIKEAVNEYANVYFKGEISGDGSDFEWKVLEWLRPHNNFQKVVRKRCEKIRSFFAVNRPVSLDEECEVSFRDSETGDWDTMMTRIKVFMKGENTEEIIIEKEMKQELNEQIEKLPERQKEVIKLRHPLDGARRMTMSEIGEILGVTKSCVDQVEQKVMRKLRSWILYVDGGREKILKKADEAYKEEQRKSSEKSES